MNVLNRVAGVLLAIILIAAGAGIFYVAAMNPFGASDYLQAWAAFLGDGLSFPSQVASAAAGGLLGLIGLFLLYLEVPRRARTTVQLRKIAGGSGLIMVEAIKQRVQHDVETVSGVRPAKVEISSNGKSVRIRIDIVTDPFAEPAGKAEEACGVVRQGVEGQMGVRIKDVKVNVVHGTIHTPGGHHEHLAGHAASDVAPPQQPTAL